MAGIGWRLERWIERDSLGSSLGAILTGVAVTSGPWLLTTAVLVLMRVTAVASGVPEVTDGERVITVVYAAVIVLSAPVDIVLTRYTADCVYRKQWHRIAAPLRGALAVGLAAFAAVGAAAMWLCRAPSELATPGTVLAAVVGGQWLLLSAAGGLSSPGIILRAFAAGAPVSVACWVVLTRWELLGPAGYLYGFGAGQLLTLGLLMWGVFRALPAADDETASARSAIRDYWLLAAGAFAFNAGLWIDKLVILVAGGGEIASEYAALAAVAWLSVVPACAYLFVAVETEFHDRFRDFYDAIHRGATLGDLEAHERALRVQVDRTLLGTASVQAGVTMTCMLLAPSVVEALGLVADHPHAVEWLLAGAGLQMAAVAATLLLYYFDFRREALTVAVTQLTTNAVFTAWIGPASAWLGCGYAIACALTSAVAVALLRWRVPTLLPRTFQSQPFATEP